MTREQIDSLVSCIDNHLATLGDDYPIHLTQFEFEFIVEALINYKEELFD